MPLASLLCSSPTFHHFPHLPEVDCALLGAGSQVGQLVYVLGSHESPCGLSCESGSFSCHCNPCRFLQPEFLRLYFPVLEPWVAGFVSLPSCPSRLIHMRMWEILSSCHCLACLVCHLAMHPLCPGCLSLIPLLVWMNVSLTPWLSDFHEV